MKTLFKLLAVLLLATPAGADELHLDIGLTAYHFDREAVSRYNFNEVNPGLGLRWTSGDFHRMAGIYKNSDRRTSVYAMLGYTPIHLGPVSLGAVAGAVTGYDVPYKPAAGLYAVIKATDSVRACLTVVPTIKSQNVYGFAGLQVSISL